MVVVVVVVEEEEEELQLMNYNNYVCLLILNVQLIYLLIQCVVMIYIYLLKLYNYEEGIAWYYCVRSPSKDYIGHCTCRTKHKKYCKFQSTRGIQCYAILYILSPNLFKAIHY